MKNNGNDQLKYSADVVVIGGGAGGLPAAATAIEAGVKSVIILERNRILGGMGRMPAGIFAVGSPVQQRMGIHHTPDDLFKIHMEYSNWMCDARLVRTWFNGCGEVIKWLEEKGLEFVVAPSGELNVAHQTPRDPIKTGNAIMNAVVKVCEDSGVKILTETRALKFLTDEQGRITDVIANRNGKEIRISGKVFIISTGPISGNKDLMKKYYPKVNFDNVRVISGLPANTGDGMIMAQHIGAADDGLISSLWIGPGDHKMSMITNNLVRRPHMIWVNKNGMRFADEGLHVLHKYFFGWLAGFAMDLQPDRTCYAIFDHNTLDKMINENADVHIMEQQFAELDDDEENLAAGIDRESGPRLNKMGSWLKKVDETLQSEAKRGILKVSDSLEGIANWMGVDPTILKETVNQYNADCHNGYDADFLKSKEYLFPISTPPFYAIKSGQGMDSAFGGIRINHRMEVLDKAIKPIPGLYAAGAITSGWLGPGFTFGGSAMGFAVFSGYSAGKNAAAYLSSIEKK